MAKVTEEKNNLPVLTQRTVPTYRMETIQAMGAALAKSGLFGIKTAEQAVALMLVAQAEGRHPASVAQDYHIIQNRPSLKADAILARFQAAGGVIEWQELTEEKATARFWHPKSCPKPVSITWTMDMAKRSRLAGKDNWQNYPRAMLRARVVSEGVRTCYPAVCTGFYTPEEMSDEPEAAMPPPSMDVAPAEPDRLLEQATGAGQTGGANNAPRQNDAAGAGPATPAPDSAEPIGAGRGTETHADSDTGDSGPDAGAPSLLSALAPAPISPTTQAEITARIRAARAGLNLSTSRQFGDWLRQHNRDVKGYKPTAEILTLLEHEEAGKRFEAELNNPELPIPRPEAEGIVEKWIEDSPKPDEDAFDKYCESLSLVKHPVLSKVREADLARLLQYVREHPLEA